MLKLARVSSVKAKDALMLVSYKQESSLSLTTNTLCLSFFFLLTIF